MYGFAQGIGDFLGDFNDESSKIRQTNEKKASDDAAIEQKALEHLANADDPQIRAAAVTAMLTPKKGSGGSGLSKWFGQQRDHPVFDQVHQLMNGGGPGGAEPVQPFLSEEEKAAQHRAGTITGATRGAAQGMREEGLDVPPGMIEGVARGAAGAPQRVIPPKPGTVVMKDGTRQAATQQSDGMFYDQYNNPINDEIAEWHPNGSGMGTPDPNKHGSWVTSQGADGKYYKQFTTAEGVKQGQPVETTGPQAPPNQIFQTPGGFTGVAPGRAGGAPPHVVDVAGGAGAVTKTEQPSVTFDGLRQIAKDVEDRAQKSVAHFGGIPPDARELQAARDREAQAAKFENWNALQAQIATAQRAVGGAVQGSGAPPAPIQPAAPKAVPGKPGAAAAPAAPTKPGAPAAKPGAAKPKAALPGKLDVDAILKELSKFQQ